MTMDVLISSTLLGFLPSLINPLLLGIGALLVLVPIIIHLLNKRKFRVVDWAAMDFLRQAEKLNKRRVQLEDLLLLLLRCLAVLLIGFLLARPFLKAGFLGDLLDTARYERILVIDDSLSMQATAGEEAPFDTAREQVETFLSELATSGGGDGITVYRTSQPRSPVLIGQPLNGSSLAEVMETIKDIEPSDTVGDYEAVFREVQRRSVEETGELNRILYVVTDMRRRDWQNDLNTDQPGTALAALKNLAESESLVGCFVIDTGDPDAETGNLTIESVIPQDKTLVGGVGTRFDVTVKNHGSREARNIELKFSAAQSLGLEDRIGSIPPGGEVSVPFTYAFAQSREGAGLGGIPTPIEVELKSGDAGVDRLSADNVRYFPGRVLKGIKVLIVDGDSGADVTKSDVFFLARALAPRGAVVSGVDLRVVDDQELLKLRLDDYQMVYLCNVYQPPVDELVDYVRKGGGLAFALGNRIDEAFYNRRLFADGKGILPGKLISMEGDSDSRDTWSGLSLDAANHPALRIFEGENNPLLEWVKVFRRWEIELPDADLADAPPPPPPASADVIDPADPDALADTNVVARGASPVTVLTRFTDNRGGPAMVEKTFGKGRVFTFAMPLDLDWTNWPQEGPSYLIAMQELTRHLARDDSGAGDVRVGGSFVQPVDLTKYNVETELTGPENLSVPVQAKKSTDEETGLDAALWRAEFQDVKARGFYEMLVSPNDGGEPERILFAANIDPAEGDLSRVPSAEFKSALGDAPVELEAAFPGSGADVGRARSEIWKTVLFILLAVLLAEMLFAWWLGKNRAPAPATSATPTAA